MTAQLPFQIIDRLSKIGIGRVRTHDTNGLHGVKPKSSGEHIWSITKFIHHCQYLFAGALTYVGVAVEYTGNRSNGDPCMSRNVVYIHSIIHLTFCKRLHAKSIIHITNKVCNSFLLTSVWKMGRIIVSTYKVKCFCESVARWLGGLCICMPGNINIWQPGRY